MRNLTISLVYILALVAGLTLGIKYTTDDQLPDIQTMRRANNIHSITA